MGLVKAIYEKFGPKIELETKRIGGALYKNDLFEKVNTFSYKTFSRKIF